VEEAPLPTITSTANTFNEDGFILITYDKYRILFKRFGTNKGKTTHQLPPSSPPIITTNPQRSPSTAQSNNTTIINTIAGRPVWYHQPSTGHRP
jgi:hypothetical protein